jgi:hypothetical protein
MVQRCHSGKTCNRPHDLVYEYIPLAMLVARCARREGARETKAATVSSPKLTLPPARPRLQYYVSAHWTLGLRKGSSNIRTARRYMGNVDSGEWKLQLDSYFNITITIMGNYPPSCRLFKIWRLGDLIFSSEILRWNLLSWDQILTLSIGPNWGGSTWKRGQNQVFETSCFK